MYTRFNIYVYTYVHTAYIRTMAEFTPYFKKSISSQVASISAWWTVFPWPIMVEASNKGRYFPLHKSAAFQKIDNL